MVSHSLEQLSISYNGGKDCLVLLVIYLAALHSHYSRPLSTTGTSAANHNSPFPAALESIYIQPPHPFTEVDDFVESSSKQYRLSLATSTRPMKAAFAEYLERKQHVRAIFVGTRRTDPHGGQLTHFDPTDRGWPSFVRVHPVIDWHYQEIWAVCRPLSQSCKEGLHHEMADEIRSVHQALGDTILHIVRQRLHQSRRHARHAAQSPPGAK